jgi:flavin reductase (DIM6/NTAB) family NADH-FMN oxidoreductase RutF/LAS superfamily LD-carboxypeptidase LdcB
MATFDLQLLATLGITPQRVHERGLVAHEEAQQLVLVEVNAQGREFQLQPQAAQAWAAMKAAAAGDGVTLVPESAFRSVARQAEIIRAKLDSGDSIDNILQWVAPPGASEHHTGRAIDIGTPGSVALQESFEDTTAFTWLQRHAARFGFVMSYPRGNPQGYGYEPWHWCWHPPTGKETAIYSYEPAHGHGLPHDPFNAIVGPRPIGWIGTHNGHGGHNLAPYSFFNAFNYVPPIVGFSSISAKDTLRNAQDTGEFTWNLVTRPLVERMNETCAAVPPEVDEFALAGVTPLASTRIAAPRVAESPVTFECRVTQIVQLQTAAGATVPSWLVLGEVVAVHIAQQLLVDGIYDTAAAQPVLRGGGPADYFAITPENNFKLWRPGSKQR